MSAFIYALILVLMLGCSSLPNNSNRSRSTALPPSSNTRLGQKLEARLGPPRPQESAFVPLVTGQEALLARLVSTQLADRTLDIQYYIWANDLTGQLMMASVIDAADRGVRVRIMLDDLNQGKHEKILAILDSHPHIEVRMVNPFAHRQAQWLDVLRFSKVNKRMHNKVFIADNLLGIIGGRNIGNEYFWASQDMNFGDFDLWSSGPVVRDLSKEFDAYWNSEIAYPIASLVPDLRVTPDDFKRLREDTQKARAAAEQTEYSVTLAETFKSEFFAGSTTPVFWSSAMVVSDPPEKLYQAPNDQTATARYQLRPLVDATEKELILISPYFIPEQAGIDFFKSLQRRGVRTLVLTNSLASSDVVSVFSGYKGFRKDLLRAGVDLYEQRRTMSKTLPRTRLLGSSSSQSGLHGKVFIFDRKKVYVGSMNLDPRSLDLNSEIGVIVESPALATSIAEGFIKNLPATAYRLRLNKSNDLEWESHDKGHIQILDKDPETTWWKRFKAGVMSIVIPTSQL